MKLFRWTFTAVITPFTSDDKIDWQAFWKIVDNQIENWIDWIVFVWTTGESPTLTHDEHFEILEWSVKYVNWRCKVIHGTWSNSTHEAIDYSSHAQKCWADWLLVVAPYYNKPTQEWLYQHYMAIANSVDLPIIVYNIKWRTWVNIETSTLLRLSEHKNIVAVKEASGDINQMMDVIQKLPKDFSVLSWDDNLSLPLIALWWDWVISVASNVVPALIKKMIDFCLQWNFVEWKKLHYQLLDFMKTCFIETNPIPVKEMMALLWYCKPDLRLPMCRASEKSMEKIKRELDNLLNI